MPPPGDSWNWLVKFSDLIFHAPSTIAVIPAFTVDGSSVHFVTTVAKSGISLCKSATQAATQFLGSSQVLGALALASYDNRFAKPVYGVNLYRGFESRPLRSA
jgi:hypothetical protein